MYLLGILPAPIAHATRSNKRPPNRMVRSPKPLLGFGGSERCIDFPNRGRYLLVGTGTTVPAGIEKYFKNYKQSTNLACQP